MKRIYRIACLAMFCGTMASTMQGQNNLLRNADFEGEWLGSSLFDRRPTSWKMRTAIAEPVSDARTGGNGSTVLMAYLDAGGGMRTNNESPEEQARSAAFKLEKGATYKLTIWHKSNRPNLRFSIYINFYQSLPTDETYISQNADLSFKTAGYGDWTKYEETFTVPNDNRINAGSLSINFPYRSREKIYLDDLSLVKSDQDTSTPALPKPEKPQVKKFERYQREVVLTWGQSQVEGVTYEIKVGDKEYKNLTGTSFTIEGLQPDSPYQIEICSVKDNVKSDYVKLPPVRTQPMTKGIYDEDRIPYLRTIEPAGSCKGRVLKLYYNDLANPRATITYKLNGLPITPTNNTLVFPEFDGIYKRFQLEVHIDEGEGRVWDILYNELSVQNIK